MSSDTPWLPLSVCVITPPDKKVKRLSSGRKLLSSTLALITRTKPFTIDDYRKILTDSKASPIQQYNMLLNHIGVHVIISDAAIDHAAQQAQQSQTGARQLARTVTEALQPAVYKTRKSDALCAVQTLSDNLI